MKPRVAQSVERVILPHSSVRLVSLMVKLLEIVISQGVVSSILTPGTLNFLYSKPLLN